FIGKPLGQENGRTVFEPVAFKSLALTNEPNLPLPPLANKKDNMQTITEILQLNADATAEQIIEAARNLRGQSETLANTVTTRETALSAAQTELANAVARANTAQTRLIGMILDNAVRENRITLAQRDHWKSELEKDLAAAEAQLANQQ